MARIVFRADASSIIGSGHVVRCMALADRLRLRGAEVGFICRDLPGHLCDWLEERGHPVHRLPPQDITNIADDAMATKEALARIETGSIDWLVVDHYGLDASWQSEVRPSVQRIMVIDDLANRRHDCDLLLDQNFRLASGNPYAELAPGAQVLLGPRYALLRPEFAQARAKSGNRNGAVRRLMICFGGSDPRNDTATALAAIAPWANQFDRIDVVLGKSNPHNADIAALCAEMPNIRLHCPAIDIAGLLAEADLAIGAGGTMTWERACVGVPTLAFGTAGNQQSGLADLIEAGYLIGLPALPASDSRTIANWIDCALGNPPLLRGLAKRSFDLVDGLGAERIADILVSPSLHFRPATLADSEAIRSWRNHPSVRTMSLDSREIPETAHQAWMQNILDNPARRLLIVEREGRPVGVVRFDLEGQAATISVYRTPPPRPDRCGLIRAATDWLRRQHPEIRRIRAVVVAQNTASLAAFRAAGYRDAENRLEIELDKP